MPEPLASEPGPKTGAPDASSLFVPGRNCAQVAITHHAALLVDCANYYHALYEAIRKARHSIFVLGWDIDSRIRLVRTEEEEEGCPSRFFDIIQHKARANPDVRIYLNRWSYSFYMATDKEAFSRVKWRLRSAPNVHYCLDSTVPLGGCHHQKIVVVDDELAFCGGADVSRGRWDRREHYPHSAYRVDPDATCKLGLDWKFGPFHDIQIMVDGPAAQALAAMVRQRWAKATGQAPTPIRPLPSGKLLPAVWPKFKVHLADVPVAITVTEPPLGRIAPVRQAERLYLDMINRAEKFIYMENQYFTHQPIATALNARLKQKPELRVLLVSSCNPEGIMERKAMWYGRVLFRDLLEDGSVKSRVALTYPISHIGNVEKPVRIHSKLMVVDDMYLRVGSSNANNRSMTLDTECDLVLAAVNASDRKNIAALRNDLIREHTGREIKDIEALVQSGAPIRNFLEDVPHSRQHLRRAEDGQYRKERFAPLARKLGDPKRPYLSYTFTRPLNWIRRGLTLRLAATIAAIISLALLWYVTPLSQYASPEKLSGLLDRVQAMPFAVPVSLLLYALGCMLFIPHVLLTAAALLVLPPMQAFLVAMGGSLLSAAIGFGLGMALGMKSLKAMLGRYAEKIQRYAHQGGLIGITLLRLVPIAPYTVVNMTLGMSRVPFLIFISATFLALFPGIASFAFLGHSLTNMWQDPDPANIAMAATSLAVWIAIVVASHWLGKRWQAREQPQKPSKKAP